MIPPAGLLPRSPSWNRASSAGSRNARTIGASSRSKAPGAGTRAGWSAPRSGASVPPRTSKSSDRLSEIPGELGADLFRQHGHVAVFGMAEADDDLAVLLAEQLDLLRREGEMDELH